MSVPANREYHFKNLRDRYTNCTYVDGNLEITWIQNITDLNFLQHIREVTGYVLLSHIDLPQVILPRLQIIRGRTTFKLNKWEEAYGLFVSFSHMNTLELPALRDILGGSVGFFNNYNLCHVRSINWDEILSAPQTSMQYTFNFSSPERECAPCHPSCEAGCWGEGPHNCQRFSKLNCSPQCSQGRCFGPKPRECCHLFCAGGCTGPTQQDCLACKNFYDDGVCKQECPPMQIYNPTNYFWEPNPDGKYAYGATCVRKCPEHLLKDNGACVRKCPNGKMPHNSECVPCKGVCPKTCPGEGTVHSDNIGNYKDCTIIEGSLEILDQSFNGFQHVYANFSFGPRYIKMDPERLEVFSTVKEITGFINIQAHHENFTTLNYFRNLEVVGGRQLKENLFASVYIVKTSLKSLELKSLKRVNSGSIVILENSDLCFVEDIDWSEIKKSSDHEVMVQKNRNATECHAEGMQCSEQCSKAGCWGKGPEQCLDCQNVKYKARCLDSCKSLPRLYQVNSKTCGDCHAECKDFCHGPNADNCGSCVNVKDGRFCVAECPIMKHAMNGTCINCHKTCVGCRGPRNTIAPDGCISCEKAIIGSDATIEQCLMKDESCPDGYYSDYVLQEEGPLKQLSGKALAETFAEKARDPGRYLMIPGDKFMRLPSYTNQDEKDLIRTLAPVAMAAAAAAASTVDVPSTIAEADEYLQPKTRPSIMLPGPSAVDPSDEVPKSLRYCKDPLKPDDETDGNGKEVGVGGIRLNLPLDEDDYLMPTCQSQNQSTPGYMDLIGVPASVDNPDNASSSIGLKQSDSIIQMQTAGAGLHQQQSSPPTQTIGIPLSPTETEATSSEHEYYNDLQRELIPLHRNETTV
uniref:receptor protein-tyrosine kinase n=1 Tax=Anopheles minimus TaxID=112268 RepID=A0A182WA18_9DIPT